MGFIDDLLDNEGFRALSGSILLICSMICVWVCIYKYAVCQDKIAKNKLYPSNYGNIISDKSNTYTIKNNRNEMITIVVQN